MTETDVRAQRRTGSPKREAILRAATAVFGRVGYLGASIDGVAADAGVSTRTLYNHFAGKEHLFVTVLTESSRRVAAAREAMIDAHLGSDLTDLRAGLTALARAWLRPQPEFAEHCAIVQRINAEAERFPAELHRVWRESGPLRVQRALAGRFAGLAGRGLLVIDDPEWAAQHFVALIATTVTGPAVRCGLPVFTEAEIEAMAVRGVRAFLDGHLPRTPDAASPEPGRGRPAGGTAAG